MIKELLEINRLFEQQNIRAVTFKGPVMTADLYGDISMRQISDVDFLIHPDDLRSAKKLLMSCGFHSQGELTEMEERIWEKTEYGYDLTHPDKNVVVDIRSRITPDYLDFKLGVNEFWGEVREAGFEGGTVKVLSPEMQLLLLCYHGAKHLWHRLAWVTDIAMIVQKGNIDWKKVASLADRAGGRRILCLGLRMAKEVFGVELPRETEGEINLNSVPEKLLRLCMTRLQECVPEGTNWREDYLFYLQTRQDVIDQIMYLLKVSFRPTSNDCRLVRLPAQFSFLYYFVRPFRLLCKVLGQRGSKRES
jgi:hypothetical protein